MVVKCHCQQCNGPIGFQAETLEDAALRAGEKRICFLCGKETMLCLAPNRTRGLSNHKPAGNQKKRLVALIYCGAVLMPFVGFFGGIYLMAIKEPGDGVFAMAISVVCGVVLLLLLSAMLHLP
jgi:hypothetical protein